MFYHLCYFWILCKLLSTQNYVPLFLASDHQPDTDEIFARFQDIIKPLENNTQSKYLKFYSLL